MYAVHNTPTWHLTVYVITTDGKTHEYHPPSKAAADDIVRHVFTMETVTHLQIVFTRTDNLENK